MTAWSNYQSLKIAMLCVHSHPLGRLGTADTGGMSVYICKTARELGRHGHQVDIYTRFNGLYRERMLELGDNVRLIQVKAGEKKPLPRLSLYDHLDEFIDGMESFREQSSLNYDLVHSHYWLSGSVGMWAQSHWSTPLVIMFHAMGAAKKSFLCHSNDARLRLIRERELVVHCDLIVSPSEREKQELLGFYNGESSKISVIPCGIDMDTFYPQGRKKAQKILGFTGGETILLYVGRIDPMKGVDRLLLAAALLKDRLNLRLFIVGGDDSPRQEQRRLFEMAKNLYIEEVVIFFGSRPQKELPLFYSAADVFVLPSHYESFGMSGLEALACGTPVVATNVGVYPQVLKNGPAGRLVTDVRPESLAEKIEEVLANRKLSPTQARKIRNTVMHYTWARATDMLLDEYMRLLESNRVRVNQFRRRPI